MIFSATNLVAGSSFPSRIPISSQARSNASDIDRIMSGSNACPETYDAFLGAKHDRRERRT
jgi:hypothetical protein